MKPTLTALTLGLAVSALAGCSSPQNEAPCKNFETTYNAVDLRDKLITIDDRGKDYRPSLKRLADTARSGAEEASGDVKERLTSYVSHAEMYEKAYTQGTSGLAYDSLDVRIWLDDDRDNIVESCEASGFPIELEPDHPVK